MCCVLTEDVVRDTKSPCAPSVGDIFALFAKYIPEDIGIVSSEQESILWLPEATKTKGKKGIYNKFKLPF